MDAQGSKVLLATDSAAVGYMFKKAKDAYKALQYTVVKK